MMDVNDDKKEPRKDKDKTSTSTLYMLCCLSALKMTKYTLKEFFPLQSLTSIHHSSEAAKAAFVIVVQNSNPGFFPFDHRWRRKSIVDQANLLLLFMALFIVGALQIFFARR